jgi:hypothetical protein
MSQKDEKATPDEVSRILVEYLEAQSYRKPKDLSLARLVLMTNEYNMSIPITLQVGGIIITGKMVSIVEYFKLLSKEYNPDPEGKSTQWGFLNRFFDESAEVARVEIEKDKSENKHRVQPNYIHLKEAQIINGINFIPNGGTLWRGRLEKVDGYFMGMLATPSKI